MKSFKQHIIEKKTNFAGKERNSMNILRSIATNVIPITETFMNIINQKSSKAKPPFWHVTNEDGANFLFNIEGTKKTVSVSLQRPHTAVVNDGIDFGSGVLVELDGTPYLVTYTDIYSFPDNQGRRWVKVRYLLDNLNKLGEGVGKKVLEDFTNGIAKVSKQIKKDLYPAIEKHLDKHEQQLVKNSFEYFIDGKMSQGLESYDRDLGPNLLSEKLENLLPKNVWGKLKQTMYKTYIDYCYSWAKKHADHIRSNLNDELSIVIPGAEYSEIDELDETLLSKIKVKKVWFTQWKIDNAYDVKSNKTLRLIKKLYDNKTPWGIITFNGKLEDEKEKEQKDKLLSFMLTNGHL